VAAAPWPLSPTLTLFRAGAPSFSFLVVLSRRSFVVVVDSPNAFQFSACLLFNAFIPGFQCPRSVTATPAVQSSVESGLPRSF
jgi:hypothetical protein